MDKVGGGFQRQFAVAVLPGRVGAFGFETIEAGVGLDELIDWEFLVLFLEQEGFAGGPLVDEAVVPGVVDVQVACEPAAIIVRGGFERIDLFAVQIDVAGLVGGGGDVHPVGE